MRTLRLVVPLAALAAVMLGAAPAADWPSRDITMVVAFPAGGSDDALARLLAPRLSELLGQRVVVENVSGDGGTAGASRVANAAPNGYQIILGTSATHALSQVLRKTPGYNAITDFTPVALIAEQPFVLVARKDSPADDLRAFIAFAKASTGKLQYGSAGTGSATHLVCAVLNARLGLQARHVPYNGGASAMRDLIERRIDYFCPVITIAIPEIEKGAVKAFALLSSNRSPILPQLATAHEQGLSGFAINTWFAVFLPKGTPSAIAEKLHKAVVATMDTPSIQKQLTAVSAQVVVPGRRSPEYLTLFVEHEIAKWAAAIKTAGVSTD